MSPREKISLLLFVLCIAVVVSLELAILIRASVTMLRRRSAKSILMSRPAIVSHVLVTVLFACTLYGYFIEPQWIETTFVTIRTPKLAQTSFRIVQISDLHCDVTSRNEARAVKIIEQLHPDIIVATGDYLSDAGGLNLLRETLSQLHAPLGVFAVTGNFEKSHWYNLDLFTETGVRLLEQETVTVSKNGETLSISGLGIDRVGACRELLEGLLPEQFNVFLYHMPDLIEDVAGPPVDLYLCGHTHGGQVALPFYGALITFSQFGKKYEAGAYHVDGTMLYVNRGLGMEPRPAPQVRFWARPEIAVFDVRPE